ncbi:MAG: hypothetical protein LBG75_03585 [Candidatus Nomurabacteria bacterium]|jgi:hypothetical protein|nr:hypothetical protein [Candidatus Nomurabacteria bacterium]
MLTSLKEPEARRVLKETVGVKLKVIEDDVNHGNNVNYEYIRKDVNSTLKQLQRVHGDPLIKKHERLMGDISKHMEKCRKLLKKINSQTDGKYRGSSRYCSCKKRRRGGRAAFATTR